MIKFDLNNRTAIITGGAQGFGLDIAKKFLDFGANVILWDIDKEELDKASKTLSNDKLSFNIVDVSNFNEVEKTTNQITKSINIDILINNAGITGSTAALWDYDVDEWNKIIAYNLD